MNAIVRDYDQLVKQYYEIEPTLGPKEVDERLTIFKKVFPILAGCRLKSSKIKNGEAAFKSLGKLHDIQVQISKLETVEQTPEISEYLLFLKEKEFKFEEKAYDFCYKKKPVFPLLKKEKVEKSVFYKKFDKRFNKLVAKVRSEDIYDAEDIHQIRIDFDKFIYIVEILFSIEKIDESKLQKLKTYQDKLNEIFYYELLIRGIIKFYKKRKPNEVPDTEAWELEQDALIVGFDNESNNFITACQDVIRINEPGDTVSSETQSTGIFVATNDITGAISLEPGNN
jgi:CHAD domain-containing protein